MSVLHRAPMGAYDVAKLPGKDLTLRLAQPATDQFEPLGGSASSFPLNDDLVVYGSGDTVLCWGFNCRDSAQTCVDEHSRDILFFCEAAIKDDMTNASTVIEDMAERLHRAGIECGPPLEFSSARPEGST